MWNGRERGMSGRAANRSKWNRGAILLAWWAGVAAVVWFAWDCVMFRPPRNAGLLMLLAVYLLLPIYLTMPRNVAAGGRPKRMGAFLLVLSALSFAAAYLIGWAMETSGCWPSPADESEWRMFIEANRWASVPGGVACLIVGVPVVFDSVRALRRPPLGHCQSCGYDLFGNVSGVCPECGVRRENRQGVVDGRAIR
jgi:hypothetical protein